MASIIRVYIFEGYRDTVIESQVFNWASALNDIGLKTIGLSLTNRKGFNPANKSRLEHIAEKYKTDVFSDKYDNYPVLRELQLILIISKVYKNLHNNNVKVVFQTRMPGLIRIAAVCRFLLGAKFIFDVRSSPLTEFEYSSKDNLDSVRRKLVLKRIERQIVYNSDAVFCVSRALKEYLLNNYKSNSLNPDKITVIPGAADQRLFFFSEALRTGMRQKLSCGNKVVFTYSGRLDKSWQVPDKIFDLFEILYKNIENAFFIILTPDLEIAMKYCSEKGIQEDAFFATYVELDGINPYLNAADYAVVLRENLPINHHASPTKIAEYLLTGLAIIISSNIGDFSSFIRNNHLGFVTDIENPDYCNDVVNYVQQIGTKDIEKRKEHSNLASDHYAKDKYLEIILQKCREI